MLHYLLTQTAECIVASAVDFIKAGRPIQGVRIEGRWDPVLAGQRPYDVAVATTPHTVAFLNSLSLEARIAALLNLFEADPRYECARRFTQRLVFQHPITLALYVEYAWRDRTAKIL